MTHIIERCILCGLLLLVLSCSSDNKNNFFSRTCEDCEREGCVKVECPECDGNEYITIECPECNGGGYISCNWCWGKGKESCISCGGDGRNECSSCGGNGREQCNWCWGTGIYVNTNDFIIKLVDIKIEGKKRCLVKDFINGIKPSDYIGKVLK